MSYIQYHMTVSAGQKEKLQNAVNTKKAVSLRLSKDNLVGDDMFLLTQAQIKQIEKGKQQNKGVTLKLSGKQIQANVKAEGGFLGFLANLASKAVPFIAKTVLPGVASGLISGSIEKAISGSGVEKDGFFIQTDGKNCIEGVYTGNGLFLNPSGYRAQYGNGLFLNSGGNVYEGGSVLRQMPILSGLINALGLLGI